MNPFVKVPRGMRTIKTPYIIQQYVAVHQRQAINLKKISIDHTFESIGFSEQLIDLLLSKKLSNAEGAFLLILMTQVRRDTGKAHLKVKSIAKRMNKSEQSVRNYIKKYRSIDLIEKAHGRGSANQYYVNVEYLFAGNRIEYLRKIHPDLVECVRIIKKE